MPTLTHNQDPFAPSAHAQSIRPFLVMEVAGKAMQREAQGFETIHLELGQPCFGAPQKALDKLSSVLTSNALGYTSSPGLNTLQQALSDYYAQRYNAEIKPQQFLLTCGSSAGFLLAFLTALKPGARVGLTMPCYPAYKNILEGLGYHVVALRSTLEQGYQPSPAIIQAHLDAHKEPLDALLIASPSNPTGAMLSADNLEALATYCHENGIRLISDEIYHGLTFEKQEACAASYSPSAIVVSSFSKYFGMTGWRIGWLVLPENLIETATNLAANFFICAPHASQVAALGALESCEELDQRKELFAQNREIMIKALKDAGVTRYVQPDGGFYLYFDITPFADCSLIFSRDLLEKTGIASTSGVDFDPVSGHKMLRFSYCCARKHIERAAELFVAYCHSLKPLEQAQAPR